MNLTLEEAASQGQASFTSTGDHGAYDGHRDAYKNNANYNKLITHFPATSPWVTAVGGTKWAIDDQGYVTENGWSEPGDANNAPAGGGGGLSALNRQPWYQQGPGVDNQYSNGAREIPDVSALAGSPGYDIYSVDDKGQNPGFYIDTGTSAATPLWAAYDALLNQSLNTRNGFLNPSLYLLGQKAGTFQNAPFNDVTGGDNLYYPATTGYDLATGWGSMDGAALRDDLSSAGAVVTHPVNFTISFFTSKGKSKGKWKVIHALTRGHTAYIVDRTKYYDVPTEDSAGTRTYTITQGSYSLVNYVSQTTVHHSALGRVVQHWLRFTVPPDAPTGSYTITVKLSVGAEGWNNSASATINVK
jgi:subtilase family serine protease